MREQLTEIIEQYKEVYPLEVMLYTLKTVGKVLEFGVQKGYEPNGWMSFKDFDFMSNYDSLFHHLSDARSGFTQDQESHLHPLDHLITRAIMAKYLLDDNISGQNIKADGSNKTEAEPIPQEILDSLATSWKQSSVSKLPEVKNASSSHPLQSMCNKLSIEDLND